MNDARRAADKIIEKALAEARKLTGARTIIAKYMERPNRITIEYKNFTTIPKPALTIKKAQ